MQTRNGAAATAAGPGMRSACFRHGLAALRPASRSVWLGLVVFHALGAVAQVVTPPNNMLHVYWYHYPPYVIDEQATDGVHTSGGNASIGVGGGNFSGLFRYAVDEVMESCLSGDRSLLLLHQVDNQLDLLNLVSAQDTNLSEHGPPSLFLPFAMQAPSTSSWMPLDFQESGSVDVEEPVRFLGLVESPGSVHFYKKEDQPVGSDLLTVILQGWPLLVLILLGAGYSGIIIWLLDRLWNPSNFPKPFIRGFWEGFWWAFVTMTTVGYGDTTPRSIQARVYGLVWIVVGITILSVFTATVTTVLTQETMGNRQVIMGFKAGVLNGTDEYRLALTKGARPLVGNSLDFILDMLQNRTVDLGLVEQYSFAAQQAKLADNYRMEDILDNRLNHGLLFRAAASPLAQCISRQLATRKPAIFARLTHWIKPLTVPRASAADPSQSLFQPRTIMYMWYGLAAWVVVFLAFVCWEFLHWRPKHQRRKEMKLALQRQGEDMNDLDRNSDTDASGRRHSRKHSEKVVFQLPMEYPQPAYGPSSSRTLTPQTSLASEIGHSSRNIPNGFLKSGPHGRFYANHGFDGFPDAYVPTEQSREELNVSVEDNTKNNRYPSPGAKSELTLVVQPLDRIQIRRSRSAMETGGETSVPQKYHALDTLIQRQSQELQELEEEFFQFRQDWDSRLEQIQQRHLQEQRHYLVTVRQTAGKHNGVLKNKNTGSFGETKDNRFGNVNKRIRTPSPKPLYRINNLEASELQGCAVYHL